MRSDLPSGTVTFLFTDVEGSTRLLHELGAEAYAEALAEHRALIREACAAEGGVEVDTQGDAFFFAFPTAEGALAAASAFTEALASGPIQVRVGLHTGTPLLAEDGYVGDDVHFAARVASSGHGGQVIVSAATAELVETPLGALGSHRLKDVEGPVSLFQLGEGSFPPLKTIANSNLPTPASSFLGREDELYEADLLLQQTRLLTVSGPGGQGKTRFALELATRAREERFSDYPDGVFSCFFASLRDPSLVLATIAQTLSVREQPGQSALEALSSHLEGKRMLLLCDNLEHLLEAASELSQLLERAAGLTLLVTGREVLRISGETSYALPPLPEAESVALVCERARTEPTPEIAELARRLEGLPLALELAAARLSILTPKQLLERLSQRLDLLKGGRDADPRQQTLRATIEWSYDLLSDEEQRLFRALSVFSGGCTLEAAEEVCDADLDSLQSLVDKSLLRFTDERFWMLETIREYAGGKLEQAGEADEMRDRQADYFLALAEENEPPVLLMGDPAWIDVLSAEVDNLRGAFAFLQADSDPTRELRLVGTLFRFWLVTGLTSEGRQVARHALERADPHSLPELRLRVLYAATIVEIKGGGVATDRRLSEERLKLARRLRDRHQVAIALSDVAISAEKAGQFDEAEQLYLEARAEAERIGEYVTAAVITANHGNMLCDVGDHARARCLLEDAISVAEITDDPWLLVARSCLASALIGVGEYSQAEAIYRDVLEPMHRLIGPYYSEGDLDCLGYVLCRRGNATSAARLIGAAQAARQVYGTLTDPFQAALRTRTEADGRAALGEDAWEAAFAEGRAMTLDEAIAYALATPPSSGK
jgi:predicted ATPase